VAARPGLPLDLLDARFVHHRFAPHAHEEFSIGVCSDGVEVLDYRGTTWHASPGTVVVLEPGEPHTGYSAILEGFAYRALYPATSLVTESGLAHPHFPVPIVADPELASALRAAHLALTTGTDPLEAETRLTSALATLLARHRTGPAPHRPAARAPGGPRPHDPARRRTARPALARRHRG
jgi:hypothetical protein